MQNQQPQHVYHQQPPASGFPPGYSYQGGPQSPAINSQSLAVGQPPIQHPSHQTVSATDAASQYHQLQSSAHHNASPYYRHLYPTYQQHAPAHPEQSHYYQTSDHHHPNSAAAPTASTAGVASSSAISASQPPQKQQQQQQQHVYLQQSAPSAAQPSTAMSSNSWGTGLSSMTTPQSHLGASNDHPTSSYIAPYPGHNPSIPDHLNSSRPLSSSSSMGSAVGIHASSNYPMDPLYGSSVTDPYGYSSYNSASYRNASNGPHAQAGMPPSDIASFWRQGQTAAHPPSSQAGVSKRGPVANEQQASTYSQDPSSYYNRSAYGQSMASFSQPPHLSHPIQPSDQHRVSAPVGASGPPPSQHQISQSHERLPQQQAQHSLLHQTQTQPGVNQQPNQFLTQLPSHQGQYMSPLPSYQSHSQQLSQSSQAMHQQYSPMSQLASMSRDVAGGQMLSPKKSSKVDVAESSSTQKWPDPGMSTDSTMTTLTSTSYSQQQSSLYSQPPGDVASQCEVSDPYAIDPQTFEDYDDQPQSKTKKGRPKKGDGEPKKEKKPRAQRASKNPANAGTKSKKGKSVAPQEPQVSQVVQDSSTSSYPAPYNYPPQESFSNNDTNVPHYNINERSHPLDQISPNISATTKVSSDNQESKPILDNLDYQPFGDKFNPNTGPVFTNMTSNNASTATISSLPQESLNAQAVVQPVSETTLNEEPEAKIQEERGSPFNSENANLKSSTITNLSPSISPTVAKSVTPAGQPSYYPQQLPTATQLTQPVLVPSTLSSQLPLSSQPQQPPQASISLQPQVYEAQNVVSSWKDQSLASSNPVSIQPEPALTVTESTVNASRPAYSQSIYDTQAPYRDYVSQPSSSSYPQPTTQAYPPPLAPSAPDEREEEEEATTAPPEVDELKPDESVEKSGKSKKKKSKKAAGDEETKKEKKPRAPRPSKKSTDPTTHPKKKKVKVQENQTTSSNDGFQAESVANTSMSNFNSNDGSVFEQSNKSANEESLLVSDKLSQSSVSLDQSAENSMEQKQEDTDSSKKAKAPRIRDSSRKKKLPKFALKFAKTKKRKRLGSSDNEQSDLEKTPPPSPDEVESGIQKRRSARNTKKLRYNDDIQLGLSDSDSDSQFLLKSTAPKISSDNGGQDTIHDQSSASVKEEPAMFAAPVEDTMVVEKILATRMGKRELEPDEGEILPPDGMFIDVEEFYCKYKNLSYLHCDWRTAEELEKGDRRVVQKLKRYKQKKDSSNMFSFMDEEPFDLQYCEVDRILALNEVEEMVPDEGSDQFDAIEKSSIQESEKEKVEEVKEKVKDDENLNDTSSIDLKGEQPDEAKTTSIVKIEDAADDDTVIEPDKQEQSEMKNLDENKTTETFETKLAEVAESKVKESSESQTENKSDKEKAEVTQDSATIVEQLEPDKPKRMKKKISRHFLVKWRGLSYEESTWELEEDLDPEKIKQFMRFKDPPPKSKWKYVKRPKPDDWVRKENSPVYKNGNTLREYQLEGINWLSFCWHQGRNCILADEMGLGKTIQSIAFINEIYERCIYGPFLIIVPLSTVGNWAREFETWTDLNVITYHGSSASREMLKEYEMFYRNEQGNRITSYYKFQVMITTFEIILSDCLDLREIPWRCCIIDEAHRLKNRNCKLLEGLRLLNMEHRVLLTGTPLQNNVEELFSLLNFLEPTQFASTEQFLQEFGDLKTEAQVDKLKLILKPMMLRRLKEDVEKSLAPKEETIVEVELTNIQKKYYRAILEKNFSFLSKGSTNNNIPNLMNTMMELRKCCIHPYLINGAEEQILYEARQAKQNGGESLSSFQAMVNASGKLVLIDKLLPRLRADGHRVLIFSQMVRCLDILEDYVTHKHYPFERIDGRVRGNERQQAIDRFSKPGSDRFVFLLCTRAGGLGINLTAADTVIIFDSDWNPQNDLQAQARCHRIGQSKAVKIYRLICRNTYEREMFDKASLKLGLDKAVLQSMNTQKGGAGGLDGQLTKKEIEELLRKGAYGALMDDDNAGDKFCEEDIDQILSRRTQVITIDNSEAKGSTFSKATFSSSSNREDIELDDPNFWEKWAKKANLDTDDLLGKDELIVSEPRRRTQTKRFGADGSMIEISDFESSDEDEETISMRTRGSRGRSTKNTPLSGAKRSKRHRFLDDYDDDFMGENEIGLWTKSECFKIEKGLLTYGWGRWEEIISKANFKREISVEDCENLARVMLLYCLHSYKGDEKIKSFIWELITPEEEADKQQAEADSNSSGRGRKPKSASVAIKKSVIEEIIDAKWIKDPKFNPQDILTDEQYKKHLQRNSNRLLLRVKYLHYLKTEVLRDYQDRILAECSHNEVELLPISVDGELPAAWWDEDSDKSLLVGIYKHGHDKFTLMRQDQQLCFLAKCGPPSKSELYAEMNYVEDQSKSVDDEEDENRDALITSIGSESFKLVRSLGRKALNLKDPAAGEILEYLVDSVVKSHEDSHNNPDFILDENKNSVNKHINQNGTSDDNDVTMTDESMSNGVEKPIETNGEIEAGNSDFLQFPSTNDLNQRFRRLITAHQRNSKRIELQMAQKARDELKKERTSKFEAAKNEREERKRSQAQKWSRREEADFFRVISSYGVDYNPSLRKHDWNKFRSMGKLEKKLDETMDEYYKAFVAMCKKVTSRPLNDDENKSNLKVEPITEERALRCLTRIELLSKIREKIIIHPEFDDRLQLCHSTSDLPDWWISGKHDKDLLLAAAKLGLSRLDYNLAHDFSFSFMDVIKQKALLLIEQPQAPIIISIETLEELLEQNGIECEKEFIEEEESDKDKDDVRILLDALVDSVERSDDSADKSLLSIMYSTRTSPKTTRSSTNGIAQKSVPNISSRRGTSIVVLKSDAIGPNPTSVILTASNLNKAVDNKFIEVIPIPPNELPEELNKNFEAGEVTITVQCSSSLVQTVTGASIILFGTDLQITSKIRWPKDKNIQSRLENLVYLVDRNEWPTQAKLSSIPTITLPPHMGSAVNTSQPVNISSPKEKLDVSIGSPTSDISSVSSRSKQGGKDKSQDARVVRRGRGRRPKTDAQPSTLFIDEGQAAKLRNLLSQGTSSKGGSASQGDRLVAKFGGNKPNSGLSSLLASLKQKSAKAETSSSRNSRNDNPPFDMNVMKNASNLIPQFLAMKPEFRDLLSNKDTAAMLLNSLTSITGGVVPNIRSSTPVSSGQKNSSSSKGPPPAHQRSQDHGSRETRQNPNAAPQTSLNLRSMRGKTSPVYPGNNKSTDNSARQHTNRKRGRPSSSASNDSPSLSSADVLDLSSLQQQFNRGASSTRSDARLRRGRGSVDESSADMQSVVSKVGLKSSGRQTGAVQEDETSSDTSNTRTTRASKRIGSRIDALALNLQAKKLNIGETSPGVSQDHPPSPGREKRSKASASSSSLSSSKSSDQRSSSKAPPMAHSHAPNKSSTQVQQKDSQLSSTSLLNSTNNSRPQNSTGQMPANVSNPLFGNLNPSALGNTGDLMNQLLRKSNTNDLMKNLLGDFMKNPSLSLDPNLLATLTSTLAMNPNLLPNFNSPATPKQSTQFTSASPSTTQPTSSPSTDFRSPSINTSNSGISKSRSRHTNESSLNEKSDSRKSTSSCDRNKRQVNNDKLSNQDRFDKTRRSSALPSESDSSSRRSSSSLLAQQPPISQQMTSQAQTNTSAQSSLPNPTATLNLANHFGGLNPLNLLAGFPGVSDLMKQMGNFPGLPSLGRVSSASSAPTGVSSPSTLTSNINSTGADKSSKRSKAATTSSASSMVSSSTSSTTSQAAAAPNLNMAFANSLMNLAQPTSGTNPYSYNPLLQANPFLFGPLGNFNMNLFSNPYMPAFPPTTDQQSQPTSQSNPNTSASGSTNYNGSSKDKKMRYSRK